MPAKFKITLTLGADGVAVDHPITNAHVKDVVTFLSGDGSQMLIRFFKGKSPFRTAKGKVIATVQAAKPHTCTVAGTDYRFFCEILDDSGHLVAYDVGDGGDLNVGH